VDEVRGVLIRSVVLDASAVTAAIDPHSAVRQVLRRWQDESADLVITAATLTEVLRGHARDALIHRLLAALRIRVVDAQLGQRAGERIGRTATRGNVTLDALVAQLASSLPRPVAVLTADVKDITALVDPDVMVLDIAA
jgi:predicted nucleic acid-binding protein